MSSHIIGYPVKLFLIHLWSINFQHSSISLRSICWTAQSESNPSSTQYFLGDKNIHWRCTYEFVWGTGMLTSTWSHSRNYLRNLKEKEHKSCLHLWLVVFCYRSQCCVMKRRYVFKLNDPNSISDPTPGCRASHLTFWNLIFNLL